MSTNFVSNVFSRGQSDLLIESRNKTNSSDGSYFESELSNLNSFKTEFAECSYEVLDNEELSWHDKFSVLDNKATSISEMSVLEANTKVSDYSILNGISDSLMIASKLAFGGISKFL